MYLDIVLIDQVDIKGILTTYRITPNQHYGSVVIDRIVDIDRNFSSPDSVNIGGTRIYNSSSCAIYKQQTKPRTFRIDEDNKELTFALSHMGVPLGASRDAHGGYYNLVLPPGFRFTDLHIVDPYDNKNDEVIKKKHFRYQSYWDKSCNTSLVNMDLRSGRGSFSFMLLAKAKLYQGEEDTVYYPSTISDYALTNITSIPILGKEATRTLGDNLAAGSEWLELKPNIMGIGLNLNKIISDSIRVFQKKLKQED